jgi:spermidine synthase
LETRGARLEKAHIGVVGLGSGVLGAYAKPSQRWTYFEIDPEVKYLAETPAYFSFLSTCSPGSRMVLGDARLTLAKEPAGSFDVLFMDAYSSDAIPVHLITQQAMSLYRDRIKSDGYIVFHVSNRFFDLKPILANLAQATNMVGVSQVHELSDLDASSGKAGSEWVILANSPAALAEFNANPNWQQLKPDATRPVWTDDFASLLSALR